MYPVFKDGCPWHVNDNMFSTVAGVSIFIEYFAPTAVPIATIVYLSRSCSARCHSKEIVSAPGAIIYNKQVTRHNRFYIAPSMSHR